MIVTNPRWIWSPSASPSNPWNWSNCTHSYEVFFRFGLLFVEPADQDGSGVRTNLPRREKEFKTLLSWPSTLIWVSNSLWELHFCVNYASKSCRNPLEFSVCSPAGHCRGWLGTPTTCLSACGRSQNDKTQNMSTFQNVCSWHFESDADGDHQYSGLSQSLVSNHASPDLWSQNHCCLFEHQ